MKGDAIGGPLDSAPRQQACRRSLAAARSRLARLTASPDLLQTNHPMRAGVFRTLVRPLQVAGARVHRGRGEAAGSAGGLPAPVVHPHLPSPIPRLDLRALFIPLLAASAGHRPLCGRRLRPGGQQAAVRQARRAGEHRGAVRGLGWLRSAAALAACMLTPLPLKSAAPPMLQGFPTIKLFSPGMPVAADYQGARSAKALADAAVGACRGGDGRGCGCGAVPTGGAAPGLLRRCLGRVPARPHLPSDSAASALACCHLSQACSPPST